MLWVLKLVKLDVALTNYIYTFAGMIKHTNRKKIYLNHHQHATRFNFHMMQTMCIIYSIIGLCCRGGGGCSIVVRQLDVKQTVLSVDTEPERERVLASAPVHIQIVAAVRPKAVVRHTKERPGQRPAAPKGCQPPLASMHMS